MHSTADLAQHLEKLAAAHEAHLSHISDVGKVVAQELEQQRSQAALGPSEREIAAHDNETPAPTDSAG